MGVDVQVREVGGNIERRVRELGQSVTFGVHDDAQPYPDGTDVVEVAAAHEFGVPSRGLPQRSYLRGYVDSGGKKEIADAAQTAVVRVIAGANPKTVGEKIGEVAVDGVRKRILAGIPPALDDGSGRTPLNDTGHLLDQIEAKT